ncbi:MAG: hypothetical protein ACI810_000880, partial [Gammaproteobacteria bacterium]
MSRMHCNLTVKKGYLTLFRPLSLKKVQNNSS